MSTLPSLRLFSLAAVLACVSLVLTFGSTPAAADTDISPSVAKLQAQITALQKQLDELAARSSATSERQAAEARERSRAVRLFGEARVSVDHRSGDWPSGDGTEIASNASRIGVLGEMDTALQDTTLIYRAELRYETTDEVTGNFGGRGVEFREGFAGLKGPWGTLRLGRLTNEYKKTGTTIDPWTDNAPEARSGGRQGMSELHASYFNNTVDYVTPKFGDGFTANAWYATRFDDSSKRLHNAGAAANFVGGQAGGVGLKYASGPLFVGLDWMDMDAETITGGGVSNGDAWQIAARYLVTDELSFAAMYEDAEDLGLGKNIYVNGIYRIDKTRLIVAYGRNRDRVANAGKEWSNWSVGAKYALTQRSELIGAWNTRRDDTDSLDFHTLTVGINAKF